MAPGQQRYAAGSFPRFRTVKPPPPADIRLSLGAFLAYPTPYAGHPLDCRGDRGGGEAGQIIPNTVRPPWDKPPDPLKIRIPPPRR